MGPVIGVVINGEVYRDKRSSYSSLRIISDSIRRDAAIA